MCIFAYNLKLNTMSKKNSITTCDFIDYDKALNTGIRLMKDCRTELIGFYIIVAINTGLRAGDMRTLTFGQIKSGEIQIKEQKTNKTRTIKVNQAILDAVSKSTIKNPFGDVPLFISQKNQIITIQQINRLLKEVFSSLLPTHCISTHSLRKTFGRRVYEMNNRSEDSLIKLSEIFNHSSMKLTRIYLGIKQEELNNIYMSL